MPEKVGKKELIADLQRVANEIGSPPSWNEYDEYGNYSSRIVSIKFGGLIEARVEAGLGRGPSKPERIPTDRLLMDIRKVDGNISHSIREVDIEEHGSYALDTYVRRFGSWREAVKAVGIEPNTIWHEGEDNPAWKGGVSHNYSSREWREKRADAIKRDAGRCRICGMSVVEHFEEYGRSIDVHHIKRVDDFEDPSNSHFLENLITLCRKHHREYEELGADGREKLKKLV
jgi:hypothetical protein